VSLPQVVVEVGLTSASVPSTVFVLDDPARGVLDTGQLGLASDEIWTDISAWVRNWSVSRGSKRGDDFNLRYETGTLSVELNDGDRRFDPDNLSGPYTLGGVSLLTPMRRIRIRAVWNGVTYPLIAGYTDDWQAAYQNNSWTYTTVTGSDALAYFSGIDRIALGVAVGAGEDSGARASRILDAISWPSADRVIATGDTTLQATTLADNTLTELLLVQDTELGEFYMDSSGRAVFRNRRAILTSTRSNTSQATFGDGGYGATGEIPYADATPSSLVDSFANTISASVSGGTTQTAQDTTSVSNYLVKTYQRLDLISQTDADAAGWASYLLYQFATPRRRWSTISFNTPTPTVENVHWSEVLGLEFGDRITVKRRPAGGGSPIVRDCFVRGITHTSDGAAWTVQLILQSADRFSFFVLDDPILGVLDSNALAY
jgi:hypothetical protein